MYYKGHNSNSKSELILDKDFTLWVERVLINTTYRIRGENLWGGGKFDSNTYENTNML